MFKSSIIEIVKYIVVQYVGGLFFFFLAFFFKHNTAWEHTISFSFQVFIYGFWSNSWKLTSLRIRPFYILFRNFNVGIICALLYCLSFAFFKKIQITNNFYDILLQSVFNGTASLLLVVALLEEIFFRGKLFEIFSSKNPILAIITTTLLFSLFHFSKTNLAQFIEFNLWYMIFLGLLIGILRHYTKSIYSCLIFHFITNMYIVAIN